MSFLWLHGAECGTSGLRQTENERAGEEEEHKALPLGRQREDKGTQSQGHWTGVRREVSAKSVKGQGMWAHAR